jgi:hypothetical protein
MLAQHEGTVDLVVTDRRGEERTITLHNSLLLP